MSASALSATSGLTSSEVEGIAATSCALGAVSALGCVVAVAAAVATREPEAWSFVQELVLVLLLSDFGFSCQYVFVAPRPGSPACYAQATLGQFFTVASMLWSAVIADVLRRVLIRAQDRAAIERLRVPYHGAVWGCSLFMAILPGALGTFGPAGPWCWIDSSRGGGPSADVPRSGPSSASSSSPSSSSPRASGARSTASTTGPRARARTRPHSTTST